MSSFREKKKSMDLLKRHLNLRPSQLWGMNPNEILATVDSSSRQIVLRLKLPPVPRNSAGKENICNNTKYIKLNLKTLLRDGDRTASASFVDKHNVSPTGRCCVCWENCIDCAFACGHVVTCLDCAEVLYVKRNGKCPLCRELISTRPRRMFMGSGR
mgnify:CR=1 FL=1|jgi:hypothetical protein